MVTIKPTKMAKPGAFAVFAKRLRLVSPMFALLVCASLPQLPVLAQSAAAQENPVNPVLAANPAIVMAGSISVEAKSTRVTLDMDAKVDFTTFYMLEPNRIVIDAPALLFRFADASGLEPRGLISQIRYGAIARGRSRIVLTLSQPAQISGFSVTPVAGSGNYQMALDLAQTADAAFRQTALRQRELVGASGEVVTKGDRVRAVEKTAGRYTIVIDPGHGGIDGGAKGKGGSVEKDLTLAMAKRIASDIAAAGPFDVLLTRQDDVFMSLRERVNFGRRNKADMVVSIHADSLRQREVRGASVYTLSRKASDELAHELAQSENMADIAAGLEASDDEDVVTDILADLTARETSVFSRSFSATLVTTLGGGIQMIKNPQRSAAFAVLKAPEVPGVLLELGYLSNPDDEKLLTDPVWQESVAKLVARSVAAFFGARGG